MAKIDDFVTTAKEKYQSSESLVATEKTDAINTGIVGGQRTLSSQVRGSSSAIQRRPSRQDPLSEASLEESRAGDISSTVSQQSPSFVKKTAASVPVKKMTNKLLEDSELEGADDLYYKGKRTYQAANKVKNQLLSKQGKGITSPSSVTKKGKTSLAKTKGKEKTRKAAATAKSQAQKQFKSYFQKNVYKTAATRNVQKAVAKKTLLSLGKPIFGKIVLIAAPIILIIVAFLMCIILLATVFTAGGEEKEKEEFGSLSGVQLEVAQALRAQGLGDIQIAAIMGNISGESGWNPTAVYRNHGSSYEYGYGLFQFTDIQQGVGNYTNYKNWAESHGKALDSASVQTEYFISQLRSSWSTGYHTSGYYASGIPQFVGKNASYDTFLNSTDLAFSTYAFLACYERPASWAAENSYPVRYAEAQKFYAQLTSSGGAELNASTETQKRIVSTAHLTPYVAPGWCLKWVDNVYENAGYPYTRLPSAADFYYTYATSHDRSQLKVGMAVATPLAIGNPNGHIGIYIGDGKIIHNNYSVETISLDDWISIFADNKDAVGWGYPPSVSGK